MNELVNGLILKGTECPYREECNMGCDHKGTEHKVDFSCGLARAFEISRSHNIVKI